MSPVRRSSARVVLVDADDRVLLLRGGDPARPGPAVWHTPGGGIDPGEAPEDAARRELAEEVGLRLRRRGSPGVDPAFRVPLRRRAVRPGRGLLLRAGGRARRRRVRAHPARASLPLRSPVVHRRRAARPATSWSHPRTWPIGCASCWSRGRPPRRWRSDRRSSRDGAAVRRGRSSRTRPSLRREKSLLAPEGATAGAGRRLRRGRTRRAGRTGDRRRGGGRTPTSRRMPHGLNDSKLLTPARREQLVPKIHRWCRASAVGHATPQEIDAFGLTRALRLAGMRALAELAGVGRRPRCPAPRRSRTTGSAPGRRLTPTGSVGGRDRRRAALAGGRHAPVVTQVKADLTCASVAAASVLAKTTRDALMRDLAADATRSSAGTRTRAMRSDQHRAALRRPRPVHPPPAHLAADGGADSVGRPAAEGADR